MNPVLHSFAYSLDYLRLQVADVSPDAMTALPAGVANHPTWIVGHVTFTLEMLGGVVGLSPWLPADWPEQFGPGSVPVAAPGKYRPKDAMLAILSDAQARMTGAVSEQTDASLDVAFPAPEYREVFPTVRHALTQVLIGHTAYHAGQLGVWRKAMGLPPMPRSYE